MKVYIVTKDPFPHGMATVKRVICYAKAWKSRNVDCEVVVYTRTEVYGRKPKNTEGKGIYEGIEYRYVKGTPLRESNVFIRQINDRLDRLRLIRYLQSNLQGGDVVLGYNGCDPFSSTIIKVVHSRGAYFVLELCELPFGTSIETSKTKRQRLECEKSLMPKVDGVIAISDTLVDYAKRHCSEKALVVKIPILVDYAKLAMEDKSAQVDYPYIFHSGTLYEQKDGFLSMLEAFGQMIKKTDSHLRFISTGNPEGTIHEKEIKAIINKYDMADRVVFTGYLSNEDMHEQLSKAAFVVINKLPTQQNEYCFSNKLGEYMAASKAIIITDVGEAMNWLTNGKDAYIVHHSDINAFSEAMILLNTDFSLRSRIGNNAQETCKTCFSIESNANKLENFVKEIGSK